jgi:Family of unknown function (DUF6364)
LNGRIEALHLTSRSTYTDRQRYVYGGVRVKTKLTVTVDEELIPVAKQYARSQGVSLSQLIESSLREMSSGAGKPTFSQRWRGKLRPAERQDELYRRLAAKHL